MPPSVRQGCDICLSEDTLVSLWNGEHCKISDISIGTNLISLNTNTYTIEKGTVTRVLYSGYFECLKVVLDCGYLECTPEHEIFVRERYKRVCDIQINEEILTKDFNFTNVLNIESIGYKHVWDLTVEYCHNFLINCDIFVSNCTGHGSFPPRSSSGGSGNVIINGCGAHRVGDGWSAHGSPSPSPPHGGSAAAGSPNVLTNGKGQCRIGDPVSCGSSMATGSGNVITN